MEKTRFNFIFRIRGMLGSLLFIPALVVFVFSKPLWQPHGFLEFVLNMTGWLCFVLYIHFRLWATLYIGGIKDKSLAPQGPYSVTRNPLYVGSFFLVLALSFLLKSLTLFGITLAMCLIYSWRVVKIEEIYLEKKFGEDFKTYRQKTPRFLPRFNLHRSADFISVEFKALRHEARRVWGAILFIPLILQLLILLRTTPWLPHPLTLP